MASGVQQPAGGPRDQMGSPTRLGRASVPSAGGQLLPRGGRVSVAPPGLAIGREPTNDIVIELPSASRKHARIVPRDGRCFVCDLGTTNGTRLNGERLRDASRWLDPGDAATIGGETLRFVTGEETRFGEAPASFTATEVTA